MHRSVPEGYAAYNGMQREFVFAHSRKNWLVPGPNTGTEELNHTRFNDQRLAPQVIANSLDCFVSIAMKQGATGMWIRWTIALMFATGLATLAADEGMWRIDQLPLDTIAQKHGVRLTPAEVQRLRFAPVRIVTSGGGGTGTFASANGLVLTNHHVALDCIRTSTLAEQNKGKADNLIEQGFTAKAPAEELACKGFRMQIERSTRDVTAELNADVKPGMSIAEIQQVRQAKRSDLERACKQEKGANFTCDVVDFNSGAWSQLIIYEDFNDVRLVYAPEKQLGYFGGDEMNFRFPRYVSDISIMRAYVGKDGSHGEYNTAHVPYQPAHYLRVSLQGVKEGELTLVSGNPGNTNRYRISNSAVYNLKNGMPSQISELETELALLRKYAAMKPDYQVLLQEQIFSLSNSLKYSKDVLAALKSSDIVAQQQARERQFMTFVQSKPELKREYSTLFEDHTRLYATDVEANADLDSAIAWIEKASAVGYAAGLYEFAIERAKASDRDREPQFQERNWPDLRRSLLDEEPVIPELEEDVLTLGLEKALALSPPGIPAVKTLQGQATGPKDARTLARNLLRGSKLTTLEARKGAHRGAGGNDRIVYRSSRRLRAESAANVTGATRSHSRAQRDARPAPREVRTRARIMEGTDLVP